MENYRIVIDVIISDFALKSQVEKNRKFFTCAGNTKLLIIRETHHDS
nr:MAG TPA: hypothetical protein [Caudoviricetes sp.]